MAFSKRDIFQCYEVCWQSESEYLIGEGISPTNWQEDEVQDYNDGYNGEDEGNGKDEDDNDGADGAVRERERR